jgi:hypothetical protein
MGFFVLEPTVTAEERERLMQDIDRSVEMRQRIKKKLADNEDIDLVEAWSELEQLDMEIVRSIRKRPLG